MAANVSDGTSAVGTFEASTDVRCTAAFGAIRK